MFESDYDHPRECGPAAYFDRNDNTWINDDGQPLLDLKEMGFTTLQRESILSHIHANPDTMYLCVQNNQGETVELFWNEKEPA